MLLSIITRGQECYQLIWSDEFNYTGAPLSADWDYDLGGGGWGNNELQTYTNSRVNSKVENGKLIISALKSGGNWTSARLVTRGKHDILYGRVEVRAKLPVGKGTWPAIWMLSTDWQYGGWPKSGEIDIMEHVGYDPGKVHGTVHTESFNHSIGTQVGKSTMVPDFSTAFHTYTMEWTADKIDLYVDDLKYFTFTNDKTGNYKTWPFDKRFHLLLNIAIGGNWGGAQGIDPNLTQATMEIEYVRLYSKTQIPVITGTTFAVPGDNYKFSVPANPSATYQWTFPQGVEVISGESTSEVTVKWGNTPGDVTAKISASCGTVTTTPKKVDVKSAPTGKLYMVPINGASANPWTVDPSSGNVLSVYDLGSELKINFQVTQPSTNPSISYQLPLVTDFSAFAYMGIKVKVAPEYDPRLLRLDLVDLSGDINQNQIFRINNLVRDGQYHTYISPISSISPFDLSSIKGMRLLVDYGLYGSPATGEFYIKDIFFSADNTVGIMEIDRPQPVKLYPNPAKNFVNIPSNTKFSEMNIQDLTGRTILKIDNPSNQVDISKLETGLYMVSLMSKGKAYFSKLQVL